MNLLLEQKYGIPSQKFVKKNVLCEKGDEITRFDGTVLLWRGIQMWVGGWGATSHTDRQTLYRILNGKYPPHGQLYAS